MRQTTIQSAFSDFGAGAVLLAFVLVVYLVAAIPYNPLALLALPLGMPRHLIRSRYSWLFYEAGFSGAVVAGALGFVLATFARLILKKSDRDALLVLGLLCAASLCARALFMMIGYQADPGLPSGSLKPWETTRIYD